MLKLTAYLYTKPTMLEGGEPPRDEVFPWVAFKTTPWETDPVVVHILLHKCSMIQLYLNKVDSLQVM